MLDRPYQDQAAFIFANCGPDIQKALDTLPLGVIITNTEGRVIYYNKAHAQLDELDQDLMLGSIENDILTGPDINSLCQKTQKPIQGFIFPYRTIRGKEVNASYWVYPLFHQNRIIGAIGFTYDLQTGGAGQEVKDISVQWPDSRQLSAKVNQIVGSSPIFKKALALARQAAHGPLPVLLAGPTGSGKEMFASYIHRSSDRAKNKYLAINCAAIPANLLEGLLFGTTRGSFTGATDRRGLLEEADGGVLYLDELDSMPLELQPKLLRFLQNMTVRRLGSDREETVDVKIVSSIGTSAQKAMAEGRLREDIFYRLAVMTINLPSLAERQEDLNDLVNYFIHKYNSLLKRNIVKVDESLFQDFTRYRWPGNIRELEHLLAGAINSSDQGDSIISHDSLTDHYQAIFKYRLQEKAAKHPVTRQMAYHLGAEVEEEERFNYARARGAAQAAELEDSPPPEIRGWSEVRDFIVDKEMELIAQALTATRGQVALAAEQLGISRQLLSYRMKKYGLKRQDFKKPPLAG